MLAHHGMPAQLGPCACAPDDHLPASHPTTSHTRGRARPAYQVARPLVGLRPTNCGSRSLGTECRLLHRATRAEAAKTHIHLRPTRFAVSKVRRAKPGGTCPHSVATARGREGAGVTQLVEYPFCNRVVEGSNPFAGTEDVA